MVGELVVHIVVLAPASYYLDSAFRALDPREVAKPRSMWMMSRSPSPHSTKKSRPPEKTTAGTTFPKLRAPASLPPVKEAADAVDLGIGQGGWSREWCG